MTSEVYVPGERADCPACSAHVVAAVVEASPIDRGRRTVLLQLTSHPSGEYAVRETGRDRAVARRLDVDEQPIEPLEVRAVDHGPLCTAHPTYTDITQPLHPSTDTTERTPA